MQTVAARRPLTRRWRCQPARVKAAALQAGLICYPGQGTIDGVVGNHVLLAPPYIISDSEIEMLVTRLTQAIDSS